MKALVGLLAMVFSIGVAQAADEKVNSRESLRLCKSAVEADLGDGFSYKFKHKTATSVSSQHFTHWVNMLEISESEKQAKKLLCKTSRTGEVVLLEVKPGRWKM